MRRLTCGSLFDGIGCFSRAFALEGFDLRWAVEIDPDCRRVTRERFPGVVQHEDVREVGRRNLEPVDVVFGGFPCQDLSVAGRRAGLAGERSGLWSEFRRVVAEVAPRWVLVENVDGLLSSWSPVEPPPQDAVEGGEWEVEEDSCLDVVVSGLAQLGFWWAYRVLDAQYDGLAQQRKRVFVVGRAGDLARLGRKKSGEDAGRLRGLPCRVLFEPYGLPGDTPPRRGEGPRDLSHARGGAAPFGADGPVGAVSAKWARGTGGPSGDECQNLVAHPLHGGDGRRGGGPRCDGADSLIVTPIDMRQASRGATMTNNRGEGVASGGAPGTGIGEPGDPSPALAGTHTPAVAVVALHLTQDPISSEETSPALSAGNRQGCATAGVAYTVHGSDDCRKVASESEVACALRARSNGSQENSSNTVVADGYVVRKFTVVECLRLMGLPDDWLEVPGKPLSRSACYRMIGNSGSLPTVRRLAARIRAAEEGTL